MNEALQSYTPTERPLEYDSLAARNGCEVTGGNDVLGWRAYVQICVFPHDPKSRAFNQPDTVSYSIGPTGPGDAVQPFNTYWAAWVGGGGVRIGKLSAVTPPADSTGQASGLYPALKPAKIAHAFNNAGLLVMAVQKTPSQIELKRYTDTNGAVATVTFLGKSPVMFNTVLLASSFETKSGVVCIYFRPERPNTLYGRFEWGGSFATEFVLMPDLRVPPARLIGVERVGRKQVLRYIDKDGRDVYLTSPVYTVDATDYPKVGLTAGLAGGRCIYTGVPLDAGSDKSNFTVALDKGYIYFATKLPDNDNNPLPFDSSALTVALESGEVVTP